MDSTPSTLALAATAAVGAYAVYRIFKMVFSQYLSPLRDLPGPPNPSFLFGHLRQILKADIAELQEKWAEEYGNTFVYKGLFSYDRLYSVDTKAIAHFVNHTDIYQKPDNSARFLARVVGDGLLLAEGDKHKRQRRALSPAFTPAQLRNLTGAMLSKANELRDLWIHEFEGATTEPRTIEVVNWLTRTTLDIIGLAGFNYHFDTLTASPESPNELHAAFSSVLRFGLDFDLWGIINLFFSFLHIIPTKRQRVIRHHMSVIDKIGRQLLDEKKRAVLASFDGASPEKSNMEDRDLLSVLIRANLATNLPQSQRLSDEEVLGQIPTFLTAGHETTSTATCWALHSLSLAPEFQERLRAELRTLPLPGSHNEEPLDADTLTALNSLPLLDATVRETLRIWAPVTSSRRTAIADDVVPLAIPCEDRHGVPQTSIPIKKGQHIIIPILHLNRLKSLWGEDSHEWKPDRWLNGVPPETNAIPGLFSNIMTFLAGSHACIGYRFSIIEMKILLHVLLTQFSFGSGAPDIVRKTGLVTRPHVKSRIDEGSLLPLIVHRVDASENASVH